MFYGQMAGSSDPAHITRSAQFNWLKFKASPLNGGNIYIGTSSDVAALAPTSDTNNNVGYLLDAGQELEITTPGNLNQFWYKGDGSTDIFTYIGHRWSSTD